MKSLVAVVFLFTFSAQAQFKLSPIFSGQYFKEALSDFHGVKCSFQVQTEEVSNTGQAITQFSVWFNEVQEGDKKISYNGSLLYLDSESLEKIMSSPQGSSFTTFDGKKVFLEVYGKTRALTIQPESEGEWLQKRGMSFQANLVFIDGEINEVTLKYWKKSGLLKSPELVFEDECVF